VGGASLRAKKFSDSRQRGGYLEEEEEGASEDSFALRDFYSPGVGREEGCIRGASVGRMRRSQVRGGELVYRGGCHRQEKLFVKGENDQWSFRSQLAGGGTAGGQCGSGLIVWQKRGRKSLHEAKMGSNCKSGMGFGLARMA